MWPIAPSQPCWRCSTRSTAQWREHPRAENWVGKAVAEVLDLDLERKPDRAKVNTLLKAWITSGALKRIERPDEHRHDKTFIEVGTWAT
jgi:hypothetical protein